MNGVLTLVSSNKPPVIDSPLEVSFTVSPRVGDPFLFAAKNGEYGNTSTVKVAAIDSETGDFLLTTRNSIYKLAINKETQVDGQTLKGGEKKDDGKPRWELVPYDAIRGMVEVLTFGAKKYAARNWEKGIAYGRVFGAIMRHLTAWWSGEDIDPESGKSHLDHALCELVFLKAYEARGMKEFDDRPGK